jgi:hypothetical protein
VFLVTLPLAVVADVAWRNVPARRDHGDGRPSADPVGALIGALILCINFASPERRPSSSGLLIRGHRRGRRSIRQRR